MSQRTKASGAPTADVTAFVEQNTMANSKWVTEAEVVWVLSWYEGLDCDRVRQALDRAVSAGDLVRNGTRYTTPQLRDGRQHPQS